MPSVAAERGLPSLRLLVCWEGSFASRLGGSSTFKSLMVQERDCKKQKVLPVTKRPRLWAWKDRC